MGSALAWPEPQKLAPFAMTAVPRTCHSPDVTVSRQVLAEPSVELASHGWARLADGTPLVTGAPRGRGWIVLFHVSASPGWSTLPMSGLYVEMLRRIVAVEGVRGRRGRGRDRHLPAISASTDSAIWCGRWRTQRP